MFNLKPILPPYLDLELTNGCPADCPMCPRQILPKIGLMSDETFDRVLENIKNSGMIKFISLCGIGEALLHPKVFEYIGKIKKLPQAPILALVTGGEKLTPPVFEKLKSLRVDIIELSLQAVNEELYKKLMPGLNFEKVMENIEYAHQNTPDWLRFSLNIIVHQQNKDHLPELLNFAKQKKLKVSLRKIHSRGGNIPYPEMLLEKKKIINHGCQIFEKINFIAWTGKVHLCCQDAGREFVIGDLNQETFLAIARKKAEILARSGLNFKLCQQCDDEFRYQLL